MILGRLLDPKDFGLVGMVMAVIGVFDLLKEFGLSTASVQRVNVTDQQISALFWINMLVGAILALLTLAVAPFMVTFYHEPRLLAVTSVLATGFVFNAVGVQHSAVLQRQLRFTILAAIDISALLMSTGIGIVMALNNCGYWSLVAMTISSPIVFSLGVWLCSGWLPGPPSKGAGIRSMMRFGGTATLNGLVVYMAYNLEKVLLGKFWGAETIGIYGRAYQLINIPTANINAAASGVALAGLSRLQEDPARLRNYFLKGYSLLLAMTLPPTILGAIFADDLILIVLGPKWKDAIPIFRLLVPTIFVFGIINPLGWLLTALGLVVRSLKVGLVLAPLVLGGYLIGLPYGPTGVAFAYSVVMILWVVPHVMWCVHGTPISFRDIFRTLSLPILSAIAAAILPLSLKFLYGQSLAPLVRILLGSTCFVGIYLLSLLYFMDQGRFYAGLLRSLRRSGTDSDVIATA